MLRDRCFGSVATSLESRASLLQVSRNSVDQEQNERFSFQVSRNSADQEHLDRGLPEKWLLAWKVPRKNAGPSGKTGSGVEGPPEKGRTFRENGPWHGRSPGKRQDLPGKWLLAWKVPLKTPEPSGKTASGMEGPPEKRRTFRENGPWHGRSRCRCRVSSEKGRFFGTKRRKGGVYAEIGPSTKRAVLVDGEDRMAGKKKKRPRGVASYRVEIRSIRRCSGHRAELSSGNSSRRS